MKTKPRMRVICQQIRGSGDLYWAEEVEKMKVGVTGEGISKDVRCLGKRAML